MEASGIARREDIQIFRAFSGDLGPPPAYFKAGNGAWGCLMSHVRAVQDALMDGGERLLILEDDVYFHQSSPEWLNHFMQGLPESWDQLYLGGQHLKEPTPMVQNPAVWRAKNVNRTHAYALSRRVFAKFLQHVQHAPDYISHGGWHIDHQLGIAHERGDWLVYTPPWWLCAQDEGNSNISGRSNPRLWWQPSVHAYKLPFICLPPGYGDGSERQKLQDILHAGNSLLPGTWQDSGLESALRDGPGLLGWLEMIAREALDTGRLPAWQHHTLGIEQVRKNWPAGALEVEKTDLSALQNYPENGLLGAVWEKPQATTHCCERASFAA